MHILGDKENDNGWLSIKGFLDICRPGDEAQLADSSELSNLGVVTRVRKVETLGWLMQA